MFTEYEMGGTATETGIALDAPEAWKQAIRQFKPGTRIVARVETEKHTRTSRANRFYWSQVIKPISDHTGYEPDELHEYFKKQFNPREILIAGESDIVGGSTRTLDKKRFAEYIERIRRFAHIELGITLPEADEREVA